MVTLAPAQRTSRTQGLCSVPVIRLPFSMYIHPDHGNRNCVSEGTRQPIRYRHMTNETKTERGVLYVA